MQQAQQFYALNLCAKFVCSLIMQSPPTFTMVLLFWWIVTSPMHLSTDFCEPVYPLTSSLPQFLSPSYFALSAGFLAPITNCAPIHINVLNGILLFGGFLCVLFVFIQWDCCSFLLRLCLHILHWHDRWMAASGYLHLSPPSRLILHVDNWFLILLADILIVFFVPPHARIHFLQLSI